MNFQEKVNAIVENTKNIFNFEFIKEVTNDRTLSEALIFNLNESYYVCDKLNAAERDWKKVDENELYQFIASKFNYDVSKIFKVKIDEATAVNKEIEEQKKTILENISKLEASVEKLDEASRNPNLDESETKYFIDLKENINSTISKLKEKYIAIDLLKKK
jgi:predicted carbohydrate-binding protein with CBM5 and CBM33 domain